MLQLQSQKLLYTIQQLDYNFSLRMIKTFQDWIKGSGLDSRFGYLIPKQYQPIHFNKQVLSQCLSYMMEKVKTKTFSKYVHEIQDVNLNFKNDKDPQDEHLIKDLFLLHGMLNKIIAGYIVENQIQGIPLNNIIIPKSIGVPLYTISNFLQIKYGMTTDYYFNWQSKNVDCSIQIPQFIHVKDINMQENFCQLIKDQNLFFAGSVVGTHYLFRSLRILYQVNQKLKLQIKDEDYLFSLLGKVLLYTKKINQSNTYLLKHINPALFESDFRKFVSGFQNLKFEDIQQRLSSSGAAGGLDPLFQLFQKALGIKFFNELKTIQETFQKSFPFSVMIILKDCEQNMKIRQECNKIKILKEVYNKIILQYSQFYIIHEELVRKFILAKYKNKQAKYGTSGIVIQEIFARSQAISSQVL